jgi:hypothetical protein
VSLQSQIVNHKAKQVVWCAIQVIISAQTVLNVTLKLATAISKQEIHALNAGQVSLSQ